MSDFTRIQISIVVALRGDIVVAARRNQVPVQGMLGPVVLAVSAARLPPGRFTITTRPTGLPEIEVAMCDADLVESVRAKLEAIAIDVESLALRPSLS